MDRKRIVLQSVLISSIVCLGAVLSAQALSLKGDVTTTNTSGLGTSTSLNTNINTSTTVTTTTTTTSTSTANDANIQFNEFFGDSTTGWVELYNAGSTPVDVTNWVILSSSGDSEILTGVVTPNGYAVFDGITEDSLATLQSDSGQVIDTQRYTGVEATQSWSQYTTNVFACDASPTELAANAQQTCTTTNSNENTNTTANQNTNTNTNTTNTNKNTNTTNTNKTTNTNTNSNSNTNTNTAITTETTGGVNATSSLYTIDRAWESLRLALTVDDEKEAELSLAYAAERLAEAEDIVTEEQQTQVGETNTNNTNNTNNVNTQETTTTDNTSTVKLSEVVHKDYIELYNTGTKAVDITGYTLEVKDAAGIKTYVLPTIIVEAGKYVGIFAKTSGLEVDEAGGRVRLLDTTATAVSATIVPYDVYANAWAFNLATKQWDCTSTATKEAVNAFADCVAKTDEQVVANENANIGTTENVNVEEDSNTNTANINEEAENSNTNVGNTNQVLENTNEEVVTETKEELKDTDQDGLTDEVETENATNPEVADTDGDGIDDANDPEPTTDEKIDENQDDSSQSDSQVWLSEVVHKEYIELFNPGAAAIDLTGYVLEVNDSVSTQSYTLPAIIIEPGKYVAVFSIDSGLKVPANGGIVSLLNSSKTVIDKTIVPLDIIGNSWSFNSTAVKWDCTSTATKEAENLFTDCVAKTDEQVAVNENTNIGTTENVNAVEENTNEEVVTETIEELKDTDQDGLTDETEKDNATDPEEADTDADGVDDANDPEPTSEDKTDDKTTTNDTAVVKLSEVVHKDYIELYNPGTTPVDVAGYTLEVKDATGLKTYVLPTIIVEAGKYVAIFAKTSALEVDEAGGRVRLLNTAATAVATVLVPYDVYGNSWAFNLTDKKWNCTSTPTKEALNLFTDCVPQEDENGNENSNEPVGEELDDTDGDGITNELEEAAGTDPEKVDTDGDGVDDPNDQTPTEVNKEEGTELSEEAAAAVEETMADFEELVDHAGEQEVSEEAAATNAETLTELVDEIEAIQEEVAGEAEESLEEAKTNVEEEAAVLENGDEGEVTNENVNEAVENSNENTNEEATNENANVAVDDEGNEILDNENTNTDENANENSNENVNENTNTNTENVNEAVDNTNALSNDNTNSESNDAVAAEDIDAQRLQEELDLAIDEINKLREENEALKAKIKELEDKLYATTGEKVSEEDANTNLDSGTQSSLTGNDKYSIVTRESQLPDFTNVVEHVYFRELRAQPGDFTSTPGEYAFHNLDKVMYKLKLPDGNTSAAIYPGEVFIMDLEGGEYSYSSVNHPDFGPYKITIE